MSTLAMRHGSNEIRVEGWISAKDKSGLERAWLRVFGVLLMCLAAAAATQGQVPDPITAAQAPIPGSAHHYIGMGGETVNPADGSVSFNLPIEMPKGRGLTMPFGIKYSGPEHRYLTNNGSGAGGSSNVQWTDWKFGFNGNDTTQVGGWSYLLPTLTWNMGVLVEAYTLIGEPTAPQGVNTTICMDSKDYVFEGFDQAEKTLDIAQVFQDPYHNYIPLCISSPGIYFGNPPTNLPNMASPKSNLHGVVATTPAGWNSQCGPPVTVVDASGTSYYFNGASCYQYQLPGGPTEYFAVAAAAITDRNGNQIIGGMNEEPPLNGGYTDDLGRNIVSWTGLGNDGDTIAVSGMSGNITLHWAKQSATNGHGVSGTSLGPNVCVPLGPTSSNTPELTEIDIPGNPTQKYKFSYGTDPNGGNANPPNPYGRISRIDFPGGGYVRYEWGLNLGSAITPQNWIIEVSNGGTAPPSLLDQSCGLLYDMPAITDRYVSYDGKTEVLHQQFTYKTNWSGSAWLTKQTTVQSADLVTNQVTNTVYTYGSVQADLPPLHIAPIWPGVSEVPVEQSIVYEDGRGKPLKTVEKTWLNAFTNIGEQTVLDNGQGTAVQRCYDANEQLTNEFEYGYQSEGTAHTPLQDPACYTSGFNAGSGKYGDPGLENSNVGQFGPLKRQTTTAYQPFFQGFDSNGQIVGAHIVNAPISITVADASNITFKQTKFGYDESSVQSSGAIHLTPIPPSVSRGNITSIQRLVSGSNYLKTTYTNYDTGQVYQKTDPCGNASCTDMPSGSNFTTTYSYKDSWAANTGTSSGQTNAYLTKVTDPLGHSSTFTWGYNDGQLRSHTDTDNNTTTNFTYSDPLGRLTQIGYPDGGQTYVGYNDAASNPSMTVCKLQTAGGGTSACPVSGAPSGNWVVSASVMDGMGHTVQTQLTSDPEGTVYGNTIYTGLGPVYQQANPTRCSSSPGTFPTSCPEPTWGYTTFSYDGLGRKILAVEPDRNSQSWSYSGATVTSVDENKNSWQRTTNGLGQMIQVVEPGSRTTIYGYNILNDLLSVNQQGVVGTDTPRTRLFTYDNLSRLLTASNPETGMVCYGTWSGSSCVNGYDANGNVQFKTDARGVTTKFLYDPGNRVLSKTYVTDTSGTPLSCYQYDSSSSAYGVGRLSYAWTVPASSSCLSTVPASGFITKRSFGYDSMGRVASAQQQQCIGTKCSGPSPYSLTSAYDLLGNMKQLTNSVGAQNTPLSLNYSFDTAARPCLATSSWVAGFSPNLFQINSTAGSPAYSPFGGLQKWSLGSNSSAASSDCTSSPSSTMNLQQRFDNRLRLLNFVSTGQVP